MSMRKMYEEDLAQNQADYEELMKAEASLKVAFDKAHEEKMTLLAEQRNAADVRINQRYGFNDALESA